MSVVPTLRRRLVGALSLQSVAILVTAGQELVLVPLFLWGWGESLYRDWLVVLAAVEFLALLDLGLQTYFGNAFMKHVSRGDEAGLHRAKGLALGLYGVIVGSGLCLVAAATVLWPANGFAAGLGIDYPHGGWLALVLAVSVVCRLPTGLLTGIYRARGEPARAIGFDLALTLLRIAAVVVAIIAGGGPLAVSLGVLLAFWLVVTLALRDQRRRYGERWPAPRLGERPAIVEALRTGMLYNLHAGALAAVVNGMVLLLAAQAPAAIAVVMFTTARTLSGLARQVATQLSVVVGVEQSREAGRGRSGTLRALNALAVWVGGGVAGGMAALLLIIGDDLLRLWTHDQVPYDGALLALLLGAVAVGGGVRAASLLFFFTNRPGALAACHGLVAVVALATAWMLVPGWGAAGAALGLLVAEIVGIVLALGITLGRRLGLRAWQVPLASAAAATVGGVAGGGVAGLLVWLVGSASWVQLGVVGGVWALLGGLVAMPLVLRMADHADAGPATGPGIWR